jgi:hypothetical protein
MKLFITGGAGFIGCNSADYFLQQGHDVVIFDNLSRKGGPANLAWLQERHGERLHFVQGDIRHYDELAAAISGADAVLHLASQVAVTTSVQNPREDFEINAPGHVQRVGSGEAGLPRSGRFVCFNQQSVWRHGRGEGGAGKRPLHLRPLRTRHPRNLSARFPLPRTAAPKAPAISTCSTTRAFMV